ncbi:MAG TPA: hypothetical protein VMJ64_09915 [Anaerolineales bacterium]|nr:hypothetical protein [Anaerolineales bacterium]
MKWVDANGYRISGPAREVSLHVTANPVGGDVGADQNDAATVVEGQFPVEKAK